MDTNSENSGTGFDDDVDAPTASHRLTGNAGRTDRGAAAPDTFGEDSRFSEDFETDTESDDFADVWITGGTLPDVPSRPGFVQRYINTEDRSNFSNQTRRGWKPRRAETLPKGWESTPKIQSGEHEGTIGVNGQVLMEMPIALHKKHQQAQRDATARLESAVENDLYKVRGPGMNPTEKQATSRASVGRRVPIIPEE